ncbi:MAG: carbohydrate ABC transporter permease [Clostridiales bacterium]|jgi:putative aldouronate transport system permease protein|nr:carbohydrate ABC transporter permease [Clostridiales bacterium]
MKRMEITEIIFKVLAYLFLTVFALFCLYPFVYSLSASISGRDAFQTGKVVLFPVDIQFGAFSAVLNTKGFWVSYSNTLFVTFYGTVFSVATSILGAYALSKKRLPFRSLLSFFFVFTLWFSAGLVPQLLNYMGTQELFDIVTKDDKWLVVAAMGMAAFNVILLRNAFEGVSGEIEEAAIVDGATEFQLLKKIYLPMCKSAIATVALFFAISRWNGFFWARQMIRNKNEWPLQVYIRDTLEKIDELDRGDYAPNSLIYAMVVCAVIPILVIYPYIQKYFAKGVSMGGVKE